MNVPIPFRTFVRKAPLDSALLAAPAPEIEAAAIQEVTVLGPRVKAGKYFAGAVLALAATASYAAPLPLVWCHGCSEAQKQAAASNAGLGTVYVGDNRGGMSAYSVIMDTDDGYQPPRHYRVAEPIPTASPYKETGKALIDYFNAAPVGWAKDLTAPYPSNTVNVYGVINPGPVQNNMTDWVSNLPGSVANYFSVNLVSMASTFKLVDQKEAPKIRIKVEFFDHSSVEVDVDYSTTNPRYKVDPNSGRDSHNNNVPSMLNPDGVTGTYAFGGPGNANDLNAWLQQMARMGVTITYGSTGSTPHGWACTVSGSGRDMVYTCRKY